MRTCVWLLTLASIVFLAIGFAGAYHVGDPTMDLAAQGICVTVLLLLIMAYRVDVLSKFPGFRFIYLPVLVFVSGIFVLLSISAGYFEEPVKEVKLLLFLLLAALGICTISLRFLTKQARQHARGWTLTGLFAVTCTFIATFIAGAKFFNALILKQPPIPGVSINLVFVLIVGIVCVSSMRVLMQRGITATLFGGIFGACISVAAISAFAGLYWGMVSLLLIVALCWLAMRLFKNVFARSWELLRAL